MYSPNDMWLLSNGGGGGGEWCWTKRRSSRGPFPRRVNAHGWWDDDQILVDVECWELLLCDTVAEECRVLMMDKSPQRVHVYRESLSLQLTTN
ncbi:unnamed protein product [Linum tenue]|uniref:Uncharacterized protein n=1 Tax=Linum tenue TaxID=586396 RepID=A0AAV0PBV6_9ROSI|nr:unnamed protein product [Linum tenue]